MIVSGVLAVVVVLIVVAILCGATADGRAILYSLIACCCGKRPVATWADDVAAEIASFDHSGDADVEIVSADNSGDAPADVEPDDVSASASADKISYSDSDSGSS